MVQLHFNFDHPFEGKVFLRKMSCPQPWCNTIHFDSKGKHDFAIPLELPQDGIYQITLDWEFEGRFFSHESRSR